MTLAAIQRILTTVGVEYLADPAHGYVLAQIPGDKRDMRPATTVTMYPASWSIKALRLWLESIRIIQTLSSEAQVLALREEME